MQGSATKSRCRVPATSYRAGQQPSVTQRIGDAVAQAEWATTFIDELDALLNDVSAALGTEVDRLNARVRQAGVPAVGTGPVERDR